MDYVIKEIILLQCDEPNFKFYLREVPAININAYGKLKKVQNEKI